MGACKKCGGAGYVVSGLAAYACSCKAGRLGWAEEIARRKPFYPLGWNFGHGVEVGGAHV